MTIKQCLLIAKAIVDRERELYPGCEGAVNVGASSSDSETSSDYARSGTSTTEQQFNLPSDLLGQIGELVTNNPVTSELSGNEIAFIKNMLTRSGSAVPQQAVLNDYANQQPNSFTGSAQLGDIINQDPFSTDYEVQTEDAYNRAFGQARAAAQSGPENVRGGTARGGFELAELGARMSEDRFKEVNTQQREQANLVNQATSIANAIEAGRRGTSLQAAQQQTGAEIGRDQQGLDATRSVENNRSSKVAGLGLASQTLGKPKSVVTDNLTGKGNQQSSQFNVGGGVSCCFIFLEALNGVLPWYVRKGREEFCSPARRDGYNYLSRYLVPQMRQSRRWLRIVNSILIKPFLSFGGWYYGADEGRRFGFMWYPVVFAWFVLWDLLGLTVNLNERTYGIR